MLSDVSTLTELSSEDESYHPSKGKKSKAKKAWQPKQVLKAPRLTQYSARTLYEEIVNGKVDLDPEYQRDVVWADAKQSGLIDSLLRNFFIPPVIFAFSQSEDGEEKRTCIDGKQRLTSIQRFMDGQIPFKDSRTNQKMWYKLQPGNERGRLLPDQYRKQFAAKQISCVEYSDLSGDSEREIFQRVQLGVALTPAERMQAISGPWPQLIRDVLAVMEEYKINDQLQWSKTRGRDFQSAATIIHMMEKPEMKYPTTATLEKWLARVTPPSKAFRERVFDVFAVFRHLVLTKKFSHVFQKPTNVSPIEFVMIAVLVDVHFQDHTLTQLAEGIRLMRKDVRSKHDDIRANGKVTKTMLIFVKDKWPSDLKKADSSERKALAECKVNPVSPPQEKGKRKRGDSSSSEDESDSEYDRPLKSKAKTKNITKTSATKAPSFQPPAAASRPLASVSNSSKPALSEKVQAEPLSMSASRPVGKPDRLAELRRARERVGLNAGGQTRPQELTPPPTAGSSSSARHTPVSSTTPVQQDPALLETVSRIINSTNYPQAPQQQQQQFWPNQVSSHMPLPQGTSLPSSPFTSQFPQQMQQLNLTAQGPGSASLPMMPPPTPNGSGPSGSMPPSGPRLNPNHSGPPTPHLNGANESTRYPTADAQRPPDPNQSAAPNYQPQRSGGFSSASGTGSGAPGRDTRFDRPAYSANGGSFRNDGPRPPPTDPRSRGQGSPGLRGYAPSWQTGANDRDRNVLNSVSGGLDGRDRDRERSNSYGGWTNRNGR